MTPEPNKGLIGKLISEAEKLLEKAESLIHCDPPRRGVKVHCKIHVKRKGEK